MIELIRTLTQEAKHDRFTQKWLTGNRLRVNLVIAFIILAIAMECSLTLLANYENWLIESVVMQYAALFIPLFCFFLYPTVKRVEFGMLRKFGIFLLLFISAISWFAVAATMGVLARGHELDPFGAVISLYGIFSIGYLVNLAWRSGKRLNSDY